MKKIIIALLVLAVIIIAGCVTNEDKITSKTMANIIKYSSVLWPEFFFIFKTPR